MSALNVLLIHAILKLKNMNFPSALFLHQINPFHKKHNGGKSPVEKKSCFPTHFPLSVVYEFYNKERFSSI